jgi:hypothetical protein
LGVKLERLLFSCYFNILKSLDSGEDGLAIQPSPHQLANQAGNKL